MIFLFSSTQFTHVRTLARYVICEGISSHFMMGGGRKMILGGLLVKPSWTFFFETGRKVTFLPSIRRLSSSQQWAKARPGSGFPGKQHARCTTMLNDKGEGGIAAHTPRPSVIMTGALPTGGMILLFHFSVDKENSFHRTQFPAHHQFLGLDLVSYCASSPPPCGKSSDRLITWFPPTRSVSCFSAA